MYASSVKQIIISGHMLIKQPKELYTTATHTNLRITSVCINISKQPINPCSLKFMMAAASLICSSLSYYTIAVRQAKKKKTYLCPDRVAWLHSTLILNSPVSCDTEKKGLLSEQMVKFTQASLAKNC
jgi:hypothetical protein